MTTTDPRGTGRAPVAEALAEWLRDQLWAEGPDGQSFDAFGLVYDEEWSVEDQAAPRDTAILRTPDGRFWHATITVTAVGQITRTPTQEQIWQRQRAENPNLTDALIDEWASDDESAAEEGAS